MIRERIEFAEGTDRIVRDESFRVLDAVVAVMLAHPGMQVEVRAHTDNVDLDTALTLTQRRAESAMGYLVAHGVPSQALSARGMGSREPIRPNLTPVGRAANRRVEFVIVSAP